jgi:hypothetical protein
MADVNTNNNEQNNVDGNTNQNSGQQHENNAIDYNKIQEMIDNATSKKENAVLKSYFQQQGMTEEEVKTAINDFKTNKASKNQQQQQSFEKLQADFTQAQKDAENARIELEAMKQASELGIGSKTLPYILKIADFTDVKDKDGKIVAENVKKAISKVLEDIPQLKVQEAQQQQRGFQIGGNGQNNQQNNQQNGFKTAQKRWNRFNY